MLLLLIALVHMWPLPTADGGLDGVYHEAPESVQLDEILQTAQARTVPPPPPPPIPIESREDFLLGEPDLNFDVTLPEFGNETIAGEADADDESTAGTGVEETARPVRYVEAEYTQDARRQRLKAQIVVQLLVNRDGRVEDTQILHRYVLNGGSADREPVEMLGFGLEEAAMAAAKRWVFRPARVDGHPVRSFFEVTFSFGV